MSAIATTNYNAFVREFYARVVANGGDVYQSSLIALHVFVTRLIRSALWGKIDELYPLCGQGIDAACVKLKYVDNPLLTNNNFLDEDFEEFGSTAGLQCDGLTKYLDTNLAATDLDDAPHLSYMEIAATGTGGATPVTAIGVADGAGLEWSLGAQVAVDDRTAIIGTDTVQATTPTPYTNWTSFYVGNRESSTSLRLFKRTHLKATAAGAAAVTPKPAQNIYLGARNNAGVADQFFANVIRFASVGKAFTTAETAQYYQYVQTLQTDLNRAI